MWQIKAMEGVSKEEVTSELGLEEQVGGKQKDVAVQERQEHGWRCEPDVGQCHV